LGRPAGCGCTTKPGQRMAGARTIRVVARESCCELLGASGLDDAMSRERPTGRCQTEIQQQLARSSVGCCHGAHTTTVHTPSLYQLAGSPFTFTAAAPPRSLQSSPLANRHQGDRERETGRSTRWQEKAACTVMTLCCAVHARGRGHTGTPRCGEHTSGGAVRCSAGRGTHADAVSKF
jgi:hypothetical protein